MKLIFSRLPSLGMRLFFAIVFSITLIVFDGRSNAIMQVRNVLETAVSGLYYFANAPRLILDNVSGNFIDSSKLQLENKMLKEQLREKNASLLRFEHLKVENQRLRLLLSSPLRQDEYKKVAEVLTAEIDAYRRQVVINQGRQNGVFVGQPVIDELGIVGQVISVNETSSRVLLITDSIHSIPVQVLRNDVRTIISGTGQDDELLIDNLPSAVDIAKGDILVTSGLGGRFPEGYPVAVVESISNTRQAHFARIIARPLASFDHLRHLLLLWPTSEELRNAKTLSTQDIRNVVEERRNFSNPLTDLKSKLAPKIKVKLPRQGKEPRANTKVTQQEANNEN
ncbi:rod shape-determining protein MreC [Phocoenobacter skyensis]|uniref:Cell shape-determining protein MreC n=1 Tax=Phocoenobacter skyensis TaxID=97481 RepID=A0A1H7ZM85_9PAST|nr:rod shape-determining protein MreC [Pasteurella skyensis]MDP8080290.1 rod shape-determining protein MreC [Pasteurella skyensis]MDP8086286.1 rod shape-determining protein MreC [Pasteurella skyensis]MDP8171020.1 rod shape-determining protein MreC [Pasteurella skyensis]MDP8174656.1 rod shape-determining protein MreC [Pasteurella skyensis]MDP8184638.1 rod shape-determining protein MreC [Pasteurella skyensis]